MTERAEFSGNDCKVTIIKMLQCATANTFETNEIVQSLNKEIVLEYKWKNKKVSQMRNLELKINTKWK